MKEVVIAKRFCGPKSSANGGYAAGVFAQLIEGPAEVTLKAPPPLDAPIELHARGDGAFDAFYKENIIASASACPATVTVDPPPLPDEKGVAAAHDNFLVDGGGEHLIPYCFVCGDRRKEGDGLRIFSGPVPDSPVNADFWTPGEDLAGDDGFVKLEFLWAALDCPSAFALRAWPTLTLLGRFAVEIFQRPKAGERLTVAGWPLRIEGRKYFSASALINEIGDIIAAANALWVALADDSPMLAKLKADRA